MVMNEENQMRFEEAIEMGMRLLSSLLMIVEMELRRPGSQ